MAVRKRLFFEGIVQGVGFRPFLWRLARRHALSGFVQNRSDGVVAEVEGPPEAVAAFLAAVREELPPLADVTRLTETLLAAKGAPGEGFTIAPSDATAPRTTRISPDTATCDACLAELFDPSDRRYRYPFINCTDCGPRLTIIDAIPYDRPNTSMACFPLCERCRAEYENPADRRFHAEPNACPLCGPRLELLDAGGRRLSGDPVERALALLAQGSILAVKGVGGFHLAVDGRSDEAVARLRRRKFREEKPLAVMVRDLTAAAALAGIGEAEKRLLSSPQRPIVLLPRRAGAAVSPLVAPGTGNLGIMLPYAPLHHLLLAGPLPVLVMTSGNRTDEPICTGNREALRRLSGIADAFLVHNRDILVRCDDSVYTVVADAPFPLRRSRGVAPRPVPLRRSYPEVLALGPQDKVTACLVKADAAVLSPHIGDLSTPEARDFLTENIALLERLTECRPEIVACDLHPDYHTSRVAAALTGRRIVRIQHHHAHVVSCMAENRLEGEVIGLAMDGTGYGQDGRVWGGEFLVADEKGFTRAGHLRYLPLPGSERAVRDPWRMAASLLYDAVGPGWMETARRLNLVPGLAPRRPGDSEAQANAGTVAPAERLDHPRGGVAAPGPDRAAQMGAVPGEAALAGLERAMAGSINTPLTSSLGRIFDGVAALLGLRGSVSFEGQAAMELEALAQSQTRAGTALWLPFAIADAPAGPPSPRAPTQEKSRPYSPGPSSPGPPDEARLLDLRPAILAIVEALLEGRPAAEIALAFHRLLPRAFAAMAEAIREESGLNRVVLSGGCFQNRLLVEGSLAALAAAGFQTYHHRLVPTNDGGISLGQAVCAGAFYLKGC